MVRWGARLQIVLLCGLLMGLLLASAASAQAEDWDAIIARAKEEGRVVVYATSSRMDRAGQAFERKYGIKVESVKMNDVDISSRIIREHDARIYNVDVIMAPSCPSGFSHCCLRPPLSLPFPCTTCSSVRDSWIARRG